MRKHQINMVGITLVLISIGVMNAKKKEPVSPELTCTYGTETQK